MDNSTVRRESQIPSGIIDRNVLPVCCQHIIMSIIKWVRMVALFKEGMNISMLPYRRNAKLSKGMAEMKGRPEWKRIARWWTSGDGGPLVQDGRPLVHNGRPLVHNFNGDARHMRPCTWWWPVGSQWPRPVLGHDGDPLAHNWPVPFVARVFDFPLVLPPWPELPNEPNSLLTLRALSRNYILYILDTVSLNRISLLARRWWRLNCRNGCA